MFLIIWFDLYLSSFSPCFCFPVWLLSYILYSLRGAQRITGFSLSTNIQREAAKWNNHFRSQSSHISRYVLFKHISCDSKLNGTVEAHDLSKDHKYCTLWPSYPCTLEAGHQNSFSLLLSFRSEHGALHLGAEWFHYGFVFVDQLHHCGWRSPNRYYWVWPCLWRIAKWTFSHTSGRVGWEITLKSSPKLLRQPQPLHKASFRLYFCEQCCNKTLAFTRAKYQEITHIVLWYFCFLMKLKIPKLQNTYIFFLDSWSLCMWKWRFLP